MAMSTLRSPAVAGGGESSDSEDDGWEIGYLDRRAQVAVEALCRPHLGQPPLVLEDPCLLKPSTSLPVFPCLPVEIQAFGLQTNPQGFPLVSLLSFTSNSLL